MVGDYERAKLEEFFQATKSTLSCYNHATFNYLALKEDGKFRLCRGRLHLRWTPPGISPPFFHTTNIMAASLRLNEFGLGLKDFVESLLSGVLRTPNGEFHFPPDNRGSYSVWFNNHFGPQPNLKDAECRSIELHVTGDKMIQAIEYRGLDSELKAAAIPFHGVKALCEEYSLGAISRSDVSVEIIAESVATMSPNCAASGTKASMVVSLPRCLDQRMTTIGYWIETPDNPTKRDVIPGTSLSWRNDGDVQIGTADIVVPAGAIIHCVSRYADVAQQQIKIADPLTSQNRSHAIFRAFDQDAETLRGLLFETYGKGKSSEARDFESAVGWLLGMLGFSVMQIGATSKTSEAPDLLAMTPAGHVTVVECTTGLLKSENKLAKLVDRTEQVKKSLAASGHVNSKVLPIIVTSKTSKEVSIEAVSATKDGIFVITRETLESMVVRSSVINDADKLFEQAEAFIRDINNPLSFMNLTSPQGKSQPTVW